MLTITPLKYTKIKRTSGDWSLVYTKPGEESDKPSNTSFSTFVLSIVQSIASLHEEDETASPLLAPELATAQTTTEKVREIGVCRKISLQETAFIEPTPSAASAPNDIYAVYGDDLNIIKIHEAICAKFANLFYTAPKELEIVQKEYGRIADPLTPMTLAERAYTLSNLKRKEAYLNTIIDRTQWNEYRDATKDLLINYVPYASDEARGAVTIGGSTDTTAASNREKRLSIIRSYVEIARNYITINAFYNGDNLAKCPVCNSFVKDAQYQDDHGTFVCACGRETTAVVRAATFRDNMRIDTGIKNTYSNLGNFIKRIDAFEGRQKNSKPPPMLYIQLREYLNARNAELGWPSTEEIAKMPLDETTGKKPMTSIEILADALVNTENSGFYSDFELIAHVLWGWRLADLTTNGLRRILISDYIMTQKVYEEIKERDSSLNVNLRLYYHLSARGYPCSIADFKTVSSPESIDYHHRMFEEMSRRTGLKYVSIQQSFTQEILGPSGAHFEATS